MFSMPAFSFFGERSKLDQEVRQEVKRIRGELRSMRDKVDANGAALSRAKRIPYCGTVTEKTYAECGKFLKEARENTRRLQDETTALQQRIETREAELTALKEKDSREATLEQLRTTRDQEAREAANRAARSTINAREAEEARRLDVEIQSQFAMLGFRSLRLRQDLQDQDAQINRMEQALDRSNLGFYTESKITKLLNDPVMCSVARSCQQGRPVNVQGSDLRSVFSHQEEAAKVYSNEGASSRQRPAD